MAGTPFEASHDYSLSSDLARLCLPAEFRDNNRKLAWIDSICFLFLAIGLIGVKAPKVVERPLTDLMEPVPVVFTPPEQEKPKVPPEVKQDEEPKPQDAPSEAPQVAPVVAAPDARGLTFAIPVEGVTSVTQPRFATPPPPVLRPPPPAPVKFDPNATEGGSYPKPEYPGYAWRNQFHGTVAVRILVDPSGIVTSATVAETSGYKILDDAAVAVVRTKWRFPPGNQRDYLWPCIFELKAL